jgi:hypothetical protein
VLDVVLWTVLDLLPKVALPEVIGVSPLVWVFEIRLGVFVANPLQSNQIT